MQFGVIGLGRMGANLAQHAIDKGHEVSGYDPNPEARAAITGLGAQADDSIHRLVSGLQPPRILLLYVPHGEITEAVCKQLQPLLASGDIVADGGNSHWADSLRHHALFAGGGVRFLDIGTSGGVDGARNGACFMVGGEQEAFAVIRPLLLDLAVDAGAVYYVGAPGSGHFTKLVHNAIEFGMVQAIAEGVELLQRSGFTLDLPALFENWMHGSVVRGWLVDLMGKALAETPDFGQLATYVEDTGEVKWVLNWATDQDIPLPVVNASQTALMQYRDLDWPQAKAVALLRNQYGGHPVHRVGERQRQ